VRENAGEVTDYLKDLDSWTKQMEVKDEQLKKAKKGAAAAGKTKQESPPKKLKTEMKIDKDPPKKGTKIQIEDADAKRKINEVGKIKSYDYAAWDKFDVEAACEEVEKVAAEEKEEEDEEEEMAEESRRVEAVAEKERGNTAFKAGNWDRAIERYTRGMQLDPANCVLPANRSMALLRKKQFGAAETDATLALSIDPTYVKAFQRRASARTGLLRLEEAIADYDQVLRLESGNKAALAEREKLVRRLQEKPRAEEAEEAHRPPKEFENQLRGALKTSDLETLKRDFNTMKEMTTKATKKIEDKKKEKKVKVVGKGDGNLVEAIQKPTHLRSQKPMTRVEVVDVASEKDVGKVMKTIKPKPEVKIVETKTEEPKVELKKEGSQSKGFCKKMEKEISSDLSKVELVEEVPGVASTSSRFLQDWRRLRTVVNRSKYLRQFKVKDYKAVFKSSIDGQVFGEVVVVVEHLVSRGDSPEMVAEQVRGLAGLPRVAAVAMFLSTQERARLAAVVEEVRCVAGPGEADAWRTTFAL